MNHLIAAILFATAARAGATVPVSTAWNMTFTRTWGGQENYIASHVDAAGNMTVLYEHNDAYSLVRLNAAGAITLDVPFPNPDGADIADLAVDGAGNIVTAGRVSVASQEDIHVGRYSPSLTTLWAKTYDSGQSEEAVAVAVDQAGAILVLGHRWSQTSAGSDAEVVRYSTLGLVQGVAMLDYSLNDQTYGLALDGSGSVYVSGVFNDGSSVGWLAKFNSGPLAGTPIWTRTFTTGLNGIVAHQVAVRPGTATVFVSVKAQDSPAVALIRFDGDGQQSASVWYTPPPSATLYLSGLAVDATGQATIAAQICCDGGGVGDAYLLRYTAALTPAAGFPVQWDTGGDDAMGIPVPELGLGLDAPGNAYLAMASQAGTVQCFLYDNVLARRYTGSAEAWTVNFDGKPGNETDSGAVDPAGHLYVGGRFAQDTFLKKVGPDGSVLWSAYPDYPGTCGVAVAPQSVAFNAQTVYFVSTVSQPGYSLHQVALDKRSAATGARDVLVTWNRVPDVHRATVTVDANANVFITAGFYDTTASVDSMVLIKIAGDNSNPWSRTMARGQLEDPLYTAQDGAGGVYVQTKYGAAPDGRYAVLKFSAASGDLVWQRTFTGGFDDVGPGGLVVSGGRLIMGGADVLGAFAQARGRLYALSFDGDVVWTRTYTFGDNTGILGIAAGADGRLYAGGVAYPPGTSNFDTLAAAFDPDGSLRWSQRYDSGGRDFGFTALPGAGGVYVPCNTGSDFRIIRYVEDAGTVLRAFDKPVVVYPNPVAGDVLNLSLQMDHDADELTVEAFTPSGRRVYEGTWRGLPRTAGGVSIAGLSRWTPGRYLVRVTAKWAGGGEKTYPAVRVLVER